MTMDRTIMGQRWRLLWQHEQLPPPATWAAAGGFPGKHPWASIAWRVS